METSAQIANRPAERVSGDQLRPNADMTSAGETIVWIISGAILCALILSVIIEDATKSTFSQLAWITSKLTKEIKNSFGIH